MMNVRYDVMRGATNAADWSIVLVVGRKNTRRELRRMR
jgi:hypothetical protein